MRISALRVAKFAVAVIFLATTLAGQRAAAQAPAAAPAVPAAPAGGIDPTKLPDIQGIHLGMTLQELLPKLKALYPGPGTSTTVPGVYSMNVQYLKAPDKPWVGNIRAVINPCETAYYNSCGDVFYVTFSGPPSKQVAVYLQRALSFQFGKFPTPDSIIAALKQKYGPNPVMFSATTLGWAFDEQGQPLAAPPKKGQPFCPNSNLLAPSHSVERYLPGGLPLAQSDITLWMRQKCGLGVYVGANLSTSGTGVTDLTVTITENGEDLRDAIVGQKYLDSVVASHK